MLSSAKYFLIILVAFIFIIGCQDNKVINEEKFVLIYTDLIITQDTTRTTSNRVETIRHKVLKHYNVTENEYEHTVDYYNRDAQRWEDFFNKVISHVEYLKKKAAK